MTLLLLLSLSRAAEPPPLAAPDLAVDALRAEIERASTGLTLPDAAPPWLIRAELLSFDHEACVRGGRGALQSHVEAPRRELVYEVRVGSPELDNANLGWPGEENGLGRVDLVASLDPAAVRRDAWHALDTAWKDAWAALSRRESARLRQAREDNPLGYVGGEVATGRAPDPAGRAWDGDALDAYVRVASAGYRDAEWLLGAVEVWAQQGRRTVLDTRGTWVSEPVDRAWVTWSVSTRAPDGQFIGTSHTVASSSLADLPTATAIADELHRSADRLTAWRALPAESEPWAGPVILEGDAAPRVFHDLLLPRLLGTPEWEVEDPDDRPRDRPPEPLAPQRRALPVGWSVVDDPTPRGGIGWVWDDEGVPGQPVRLVDDGAVRVHLMSRTPSRWFAESNGHAVQPWYGIARGAPSHLTVAAAHPMSRARLIRSGLKVARQVGLDHVVIVRGLGEQNPAGPLDPSPVGPPAEVVRHYADGHEEPVRGWTWAGLDARSLRDILAAGPSYTLDLAHDDIVHQVNAPSILIRELEFVPVERADHFEPRVSPPSGGR